MAFERITEDDLNRIHQAPEPYITIYLDHSATPVRDAWSRRREDIAAAATPEALDALDVWANLPQGDDVAGWGAIVAADGTSLVRSSSFAPRRPVVRMGAIPYIAPILEWSQQSPAHVTVFCGVTGHDAVAFEPSGATWTAALERDLAVAQHQVDELVDRVEASVVVVGGHADAARELTHLLRTSVSPSVVVHEITGDEGSDLDRFADASVRMVAHEVATRTVSLLQEFRFQASHDAAVEGIVPTLEAIREGHADVVLVHDDPSDAREVALDHDGVGVETARAVDVVVWRAQQAGARVHIIPSTGDQGPDGDVGAIARQSASQSATTFTEVTAGF